MHLAKGLGFKAENPGVIFVFKENQMSIKELDQEWIHLMGEARDLGVSIQEIKELLENARNR